MKVKAKSRSWAPMLLVGRHGKDRRPKNCLTPSEILLTMTLALQKTCPELWRWTTVSVPSPKISSALGRCQTLLTACTCRQNIAEGGKKQRAAHWRTVSCTVASVASKNVSRSSSLLLLPLILVTKTNGFKYARSKWTGAKENLVKNANQGEQMG